MTQKQKQEVLDMVAKESGWTTKNVLTKIELFNCVSWTLRTARRLPRRAKKVSNKKLALSIGKRVCAWSPGKQARLHAAIEAHDGKLAESMIWAEMMGCDSPEDAREKYPDTTVGGTSPAEALERTKEKMVKPRGRRDGMSGALGLRETLPGLGVEVPKDIGMVSTFSITPEGTMIRDISGKEAFIPAEGGSK